MTAELGRLEPVDIRWAWFNEASDFTPWLAANLDRLSELLGISLALDATEVSVGPFSADILATDTLTGARVVIENQLEQADHRHLGQILTYLAGLEANTVIWTAKNFRDEHLSAIRWLNLHTTDDFSFFAVEVSAVRIGESPIAPLFQVAEKPNDWDRQVQQSASSSLGESPRKLAAEFWAGAIGKHPELEGIARTGPGGSNVWIAIPDSDLILSLAYSVRSVGWFIRGAKGVPDDEVTEILRPHHVCLEESLGIHANLAGNGGTAFMKWHDLDMRDRENWEQAIAWLLEWRNKVLNACAQCLSGL